MEKLRISWSERQQSERLSAVQFLYTAFCRMEIHGNSKSLGVAEARADTEDF